MRSWEYFSLQFDPEPSGRYPFGYWICSAKPDYNGCGATPVEAMVECIIAMSKALIGYEHYTE